MEKLAKLIVDQLGSGWQVDSVDQEGRIAYLSRTSEVDTVLASDASAIEVGLATDTKTSDGDKVATRMASMHPGFVMTSFRPLEGRAVLSKLPKELVKSRLAIANALGVKPWDVQISKHRGGGYDVQLPKSYQESKHRAKLDEVAISTVGKPGWWVEVNALDRKAVFHPGELPIFESAYKYPFAQAGKDTFTIPIGVALGSSGVANYPLDMLLGDSSGGIIQGLAGAGKSVAVNALLYGCLAAGHEIAIIDVPHKAQDFEWAKPFVRKYGWGCESRAAAVTVMALVQEEGEKRGQLLREYGAGKWQDLPANVRVKTPILTVIMDEVAGLFASDPIPKNLPKDHEVRIAAEQAAAEVDLLKSKVIRLPAEMRAAGIRLVLATQQAQSNLGIPPSVKLNLPNRVLLGAKATKQARGHAFANPDALPWVPEYIADNEKMAKGTGVSEFEGQAAAVFKAYYASTSDYLSHMNAIGLPTTLNPEPPQSLIDKHVPNFFEDDFPDDGRPSSVFDVGGFGENHDDYKLKGAAKAAHDGKLERDQAALRARSAH